MRGMPQYRHRSIMHVTRHAPDASGPHGPHRLAVTAAIDAAFLSELLTGVPVAGRGVDGGGGGGGGAGGAISDSGADEDASAAGSDAEDEGAADGDASPPDGASDLDASFEDAAPAAGAGAIGAGANKAVKRALGYVQGLLWTLSMYFSGGGDPPRGRPALHGRQPPLRRRARHAGCCGSAGSRAPCSSACFDEHRASPASLLTIRHGTLFFPP
jgi:hypothetical protein